MPSPESESRISCNGGSRREFLAVSIGAVGALGFGELPTLGAGLANSSSITALCRLLVQCPSWTAVNTQQVWGWALSSLRDLSLFKYEDEAALAERLYSSIFEISKIQRNGDLPQIAHATERIIDGVRPIIDRHHTNAARIIRACISRRRDSLDEVFTKQIPLPHQTKEYQLEEAGIEKALQPFISIIEASARGEVPIGEFMLRRFEESMQLNLRAVEYLRYTLGDAVVDQSRAAIEKNYSASEVAAVRRLEAGHRMRSLTEEVDYVLHPFQVNFSAWFATDLLPISGLEPTVRPKSLVTRDDILL